MLKDPRNLLWLLPLAVLMTLPLWKPFAADFLSPAHKSKEAALHAVPSLTGIKALNSSDMTGIQFEQSKNGAKEWLLTASRLYSTGSDSDMQLEDVEALFFGPAEGNEETHIKSLKAGYNAGTNKAFLFTQHACLIDFNPCSYSVSIGTVLQFRLNGNVVFCRL